MHCFPGARSFGGVMQQKAHGIPTLRRGGKMKRSTAEGVHRTAGIWAGLVVAAAFVVTSVQGKASGGLLNPTIRFATFNACLYRSSPGELLSDLLAGDAQAKVVAEIVQCVQPDVLLINEFDYDPASRAAIVFERDYLNVGQNGQSPIHYPYIYTAPVNCGVPSGCDLDNDGVVGDINDLIGYGLFEGQIGMVLYSVHPIHCGAVRTFRNFLWKHMMNPQLPVYPGTSTPWYTAAELAVLPLSSTSHWDVPILVGEMVIHVLASHPTPPVFDGAEDANGYRNYDEIGFWADYIDPNASAHICDDTGVPGGLAPGAHFVIMGDLNADPEDGDARPGAAKQLTEHPLINSSSAPASDGAAEQSTLQGGVNTSHSGDPSYDTGDWNDATCGNLRADYVLPSSTFGIADSAVFWPKSTDPLFSLVGAISPIPSSCSAACCLFPSSDHRLVWVDVFVPLLPPSHGAAANMAGWIHIEFTP